MILIIIDVIDINAKTGDGMTALHLACRKIEPENQYETPVEFTPIAEILINHHADLNVKNNEDQTPLLFALSQGNLSAAKLLVSYFGYHLQDSNFVLFCFVIQKISRGADLDVKDSDGNNIAHTACKLSDDAEKLLLIITKYGKLVLKQTNYQTYLISYSHSWKSSY